MQLLQLLYTLIRIYEIILLVRIFMSWIRPNPYHPVVQWVFRLTEPVLAPVRRLLPENRMGIDFSPVIVFLLIYLLKGMLFGRMFY